MSARRGASHRYSAALLRRDDSGGKWRNRGSCASYSWTLPPWPSVPSFRARPVVRSPLTASPIPAAWALPSWRCSLECSSRIGSERAGRWVSHPATRVWINPNSRQIRWRGRNVDLRLTDLIANSRDRIEERDGPYRGRPRAERTQTREKRTPLIQLDVRYHKLRPRSASHAKDDATMCRLPLPGCPADLDRR